jgi:hypothetical protein
MMRTYEWHRGDLPDVSLLAAKTGCYTMAEGAVDRVQSSTGCVERMIDESPKIKVYQSIGL